MWNGSFTMHKCSLKYLKSKLESTSRLLLPYGSHCNSIRLSAVRIKSKITKHLKTIWFDVEGQIDASFSRLNGGIKNKKILKTNFRSVFRTSYHFLQMSI